jgi:DNA-binding transcriptional LysR family regulator
MDTIKGVSVFLHTVASGSFSKAADQLGVSPQSVSHTIAQLEAHLGVRLFNRTTRSLILTEEGQRFKEAGQLAMQSFDEAIESVAQDRPPSGVVRLSVGVGFGRRYVLPEVAGFRESYPDIQVDLSLDDRKVDLISEGLDVIVRGGVISDSSLITRRLCDLSSVLVASPAYLKKYGAPKRAADLFGHQVVQLRFLSGISPVWEFKNRQVFEPKGGVILSDPEAVGDAARLGLGIAQISVHHAWDWLRSGQLKVVLFKDFISANREVVMQYPHRTHTAARVKVFVDYMVQAMKANRDLQFKSAELAKFVA